MFLQTPLEPPRPPEDLSMSLQAGATRRQEELQEHLPMEQSQGTGTPEHTAGVPHEAANSKRAEALASSSHLPPLQPAAQ